LSDFEEFYAIGGEEYFAKRYLYNWMGRNY
jgi:hypothetical protein